MGGGKPIAHNVANTLRGVLAAIGPRNGIYRIQGTARPQVPDGDVGQAAAYSTNQVEHRGPGSWNPDL